jgi:hypothetical protein
VSQGLRNFYPYPLLPACIPLSFLNQFSWMMTFVGNIYIAYIYIAYIYIYRCVDEFKDTIGNHAISPQFHKPNPRMPDLRVFIYIIYLDHLWSTGDKHPFASYLDVKRGWQMTGFLCLLGGFPSKALWQPQFILFYHQNIVGTSDLKSTYLQKMGRFWIWNIFRIAGSSVHFFWTVVNSKKYSPDFSEIHPFDSFILNTP